MNQSSIFVPVRFLSEYREKWAHRDVKSVISFNQNPSLKSSRIWSVSCCWNRVAGFLRRRGLNLRNLFLKKCKFVATALTLKYPDGLALDQDARRKTQDVEAEERATKLITSFPWDWKSSSIQRDVVGYSRGCRNYQIDSLLTPKSIFRKEICYIITFHKLSASLLSIIGAMEGVTSSWSVPRWMLVSLFLITWIHLTTGKFVD